MNFTRLAILLVLVVFLITVSDARKKRSRRTKRNHVTCRPNSLVRYRVTIQALWSRHAFPRMFPTYRPHAQWSTVVGRTHGDNYVLWSEGENSTMGVKAFAEEGDLSVLERESAQGYSDILDSFTAPPVQSSVGQTSSIITLDGRHSKVSFMMKIIPSPDWFIGLNGLNLCAHGRWRKNVHVNLRPMDAGTDQGLTFTSPNWPNIPPVPIFAITSSVPDHPASSFFYPNYETLPRIAYVDLDIISEYRHRRMFLDVPHEFNFTTVKKPTPVTDKYTTTTDGASTEATSLSGFGKGPAEEDENINDSPNTSGERGSGVRVSGIRGYGANTERGRVNIEKEGQETQVPIANFDKSPLKTASTRYESSRGNNERGSEEETSTEMVTSINSVETGAARRSEPLFSMMDLVRKGSKPGKTRHEALAEKLSPQTFDGRQFSHASKGSSDAMSDFYSIDCNVSEWSEWSACSQTCGFGKQYRSREVLELPQNGGSSCPLLSEEGLCGSMRNCQWQHFSFLKTNKGSKRKMRAGRSRRRKSRQ